MSKYSVFESRYYYNTEQRNLPLCVCTIGMEHSTDQYQWGPGVAKYYDICYIESGHAIYGIGNQKIHVKAGDVILAAPNEIQHVVSEAGSEWIYYWIGFTGNDVAYLLGKLGFSKGKPIIHIGQSDELIQLHNTLYEQRGTSFSDTMNMTGLLYQFFATIYRLSGSDSISPVDPLQRALDYIHKNLSTPIQVNEVCNQLKVSPSWLYKQFMSSIGHSPIEYINYQRILNSCKLYQRANLSISDIAFQCGYKDSFYYSRLFRKMMGMSPSEYRKKIQQQHSNTSKEKR